MNESNGIFATTHWSIVLVAGGHSSPAAREALERLCRAYWFPLYGYVRRRAGSSCGGAHLLDTSTRARAVSARSMSLGRGGLENSGAFTQAILLRTGTVRGPAVAVSRSARCGP